MASIDIDDKSSVYHIRFRFAGREFKRSLRTKDRRMARASQARVEETIHLVDTGRIELPADVDSAAFLIAGGRQPKKIKRIIKLRELFEWYQKGRTEGAKEPSSIQTEDLHIRHLIRLIRGNTIVHAIGLSEVQQYVETRLGEKRRKKCISPETVKKEIATLRVVWNWGVKHSHLTCPAPVAGLSFPKHDEKPPFMTFSEIESIIKNKDLTPLEAANHWECLYLTREDVQNVLQVVQDRSRHEFVYPFTTFVAHTGARLSEALRCQVEDIDLSERNVLIREKKKSRTRATTYRRIELFPLLVDVLSDWLRQHPGGSSNVFHKPRDLRRPFADPTPANVAKHKARKHLKQTLKGTKWQSLRGFHVFRHSFASNLAAQGVDQRIIDEWMGHQTEEMRRRYRHLLPEVKKQAILKLLPDG